MSEDLRQTWQTPRTLGRALCRRFNLTHDAAASPENALCDSFWTAEDDALCANWHPDLRIFCNPPFKIGREFGAKALNHRHEGGTSGFLVIDRGAIWLDELMSVTAWWRFFGRVQYERPEGVESKGGSVTFGSVFLLFDPMAAPGFRGWLHPKTGAVLL